MKFNKIYEQNLKTKAYPRTRRVEKPPKWRLWFGLGLITGVGTTIASKCGKLIVK